MEFNAEEFCDDYGIDYRLEGENVSKGRVGICDPFSSYDTNYHGAFNPANGTYSSWHTGKHSLVDVIRELTGVSFSRAKKIIEEYSIIKKTKKYEDIIIPKQRFEIPCNPLMKRHRKFLRSRGFNSKYISERYDLRSDGNRIIIPIYYKNRIVSFQEREIEYKFYKACPKNKALVNYKDILYNTDNAVYDFVVVVEGILDVWRMDNDCVSTFGISFTKKQIALLTNLYNTVIIIYDNEREAQKKARSLGVELGLMGVNVIIETDLLAKAGVKDPGDLPQQEADNYMNAVRNKFIK